jgi:hypothetical protein
MAKVPGYFWTSAKYLSANNFAFESANQAKTDGKSARLFLDKCEVLVR